MAPLKAAAETKVSASGEFRAAHLALAPGFDNASGYKVVSTWGGSVNSAPIYIFAVKRTISHALALSRAAV
ncbi:MAG TPA: hypothetical protein VK642_14360 [Burkholderiales bacterium]|nr:hypothetical protein [Burkholderiales bacterium]